MADLHQEQEVHEYVDDGDASQEFVATGDVSVVTDEYRKLAVREISVGEALQFGRGQSRRPDKAEGFAAITVTNGTSTQTGKFRLTLRTKDGTLKGVITNLNSKDLDVTRGDLPDGAPLPVQFVNGKPAVGGGRKGYEVHLEMKGDSSFTWDYDHGDNDVSIDGARLFR